MTSSLTPFLYQTRTIISLSRIKHPSASTSLSSIRTRYLSSSSQCLTSGPIEGGAAGSQEVTHHEAPIDGGHAKGPRIRRTTFGQNHDVEPDFSWKFERENSRPRKSWNDGGLRRHKPYDQYESSHQDRRARQQSYNSHLSEQKPKERELEYSIDFEEPADNEFADIWERDEISELTHPRKTGESTITVAERHAFQKIFADIHSRYQRSDVEYGAKKRPDRDVTTNPPTQAQKLLQDVIEQAVHTQAQKNEIIQRYPPALRAAAAKAIGLDLSNEEESAETVDLYEEEANSKLKMQQDAERKRVQETMKSAGSDFELWEIMEKEVFSLIPKLGLQDPAKDEEIKPKKGRKKSKKAAKAPELEEVHFSSTMDSEPSTEKNSVSPLALYGPLYGEYLLLGVRLLDRAFSKPSPLALSVLPKIKSLGLVSSVLGGSTMLYNELLVIYQDRQDDYLGMLKLLSEMERLGLEFDEKTYDIVIGVMKAQATIFRGKRGPTLKAVWNLPEFAPQQFAPWREKIRYAINEKQREAGLDVKY